ncbi:hypothetical protein C0J52_22718 [Blattella germanica]|nr:hypothetical protein C0J52_22718 [Blattella germanica]
MNMIVMETLMATEEVAAVEKDIDIPSTMEVLYKDTDIDSQATLPTSSGRSVVFPPAIGNEAQKVKSRKRKFINSDNKDEYKMATRALAEKISKLLEEQQEAEKKNKIK